MLRNLITTFQRSLAFQKTQLNVPSVKFPRRYLFNIEVRKSKESIAATADKEDDNNEFDAEEYIVPYRIENEKILKNNVLINILRERFRINASEARRILSDDHIQRAQRNKSVFLFTLDSLSFAGVTKQSILENPWLLTLDKTSLDKKLSLIKTMKIRDINDFVPFLRLNVARLRKLVAALNTESSSVPFSNRVYYISEQLKVDPKVVTQYLPKRLFILEMPFEMLKNNLEHMISYNVSPLDVLKDLWAFRYLPKSVQLRLERAKRAKKSKIMPWMVRCPESILQRSLQLTLDELTVLNGKSSIVDYISERLQFSPEITKAIMDKHPQCYRVRVTKVKEVLDYLLNEAGFTRHEIAQVPRVLCHSLKTTKKRFEELKELNCRPSSLVILCRSKREYEKFKSNWQGMLETGYKPQYISTKSTDSDVNKIKSNVDNT